jgi:hypothetical protein
MKLDLKKSRFAALAAVAVGLVLPASALAEYYVPPGNSAANQYTESLPSAGGESAGKGKGGGGGTKAPAESLGARNAHKLEAQGPAGEAAAEVAAETAPPTSLVVADDGAKHPAHKAGGKQHQGSGKSSGGGQSNGGGGGQTTPATVHVDQPSGSSGIGEVLAQATGSSDDGNLGLWLPLVIVLTIAASIAYRFRPHQGPTA